MQTEINGVLSRKVYLLKNGAISFGDGSQTYVMLQKVIWDQLLACKAEIIHMNGSEGRRLVSHQG